MYSVPSRCSALSTAATRCWRDEPTSFGPSPMRSEVLVDTITRSRRPLLAAPRIDSEAPSDYTSAVSTQFPPAPRLLTTMRRACQPPVLHRGLNSGPLPPRGPAPTPGAATLRPEA